MAYGNEANSSVWKSVTCQKAWRAGTVADMLPVYCMGNFPTSVLVGQRLGLRWSRHFQDGNNLKDAE